MPEGPSILILKEEVLSLFSSKKILSVSGNSKIDQQRLLNKKPVFKSWGKHFLICFPDFFVRIHLLMFGKALINERKEHLAPRLSLKFSNGELNFYSCAARIFEGNVDAFYDWEADTLSPLWNEKKALAAVKKLKTTQACDVLLDQNIFAGSGNIVKNEVLFRIRVHPESKLGMMPAGKLKELVTETRVYCEDFYKWKKAFELRQHWEAYRKQVCPRDNTRITLKKTGVTNRRSFFCETCQVLYKKITVKKNKLADKKKNKKKNS